MLNNCKAAFKSKEYAYFSDMLYAAVVIPEVGGASSINAAGNQPAGGSLDVPEIIKRGF